MKKLLIPIMGLLLLSACANGATVTKISAAKAKEMMDTQEVIIVDVRTQAEYDEAYNEEIKLNIQQVKKRNYIQTFVTYAATRALMKADGFEFKSAFDTTSEQEDYKEQDRTVFTGYDEFFAEQGNGNNP